MRDEASDGGRGQSVRSTQAGFPCRQLNSEIWSVNMRASSVFIAGPAGYHASEGAGLALATGITGNRDSGDLEAGPGTLARERARAKRMRSLRRDELLKTTRTLLVEV